MQYTIPLGVYADEHILAPGESITYMYDSQITMLNMTIRLDNANSYPQNDSVSIVLIGYGRGFTTQYTLTSFRYGVYIDEIRVNKIIITNNSDLANAEVYIETMTKPLSEYPNEVAQFITQINTSTPPNNQSLYQGANNRYTGTLADAIFLASTPIGTPMAVRQINAQATSSSSLGFVTIPFAQNFTFNANIEPLGIINYTTTFAFKTDAITNLLPGNSTITNATVNYIMIDYYFDFHMQVNLPASNDYTITTSGSTTYIQYSGNVYLYYYNNTSLPLANATVSSITNSNSNWTLSPTSGTTNSSGNVPITITQPLNSTSPLGSFTIDASTTIAGISRSASATITPNFDYNIQISFPNGNNYTLTTSGSTTYLQCSGNILLSTNTSLPLPNFSLQITESNSEYTLSPTTGTTNSSGEIPFTITVPLESNTNLTNTISTSITIANINKSASATITPNFSYGIQVNLPAGNNYTLTTSGSTTYIQYSGNVYLYYTNTTTNPFTNMSVASITNSNSNWTLSPTSGTTNSSGQVPITITQPLNSTSPLGSFTIGASTTIANIQESANATLTPNFGFTITNTISTPPTTTISANTTLSSNLVAYNLVIDSGVTVTTNGYSILCAGSFTNNGTIVTGQATQGGTFTSSNGVSITTSYGGSGGGGGGLDGGIAYYGGNGGSTIAAGGAGGNTSGTPGSNGSSPAPPTLSNSEIQTLSSNIYDYLSGASGGFGGNSQGGNGGYGAYGLYIQATSITAGTINASGGSGNSGSAGGGGGGGGVIILAYSSSGTYTAGTYNVSGGAGGAGGSEGGAGGNGGNGQVLTYQYTTQPVIINAATLTATITLETTTSLPIPNQTINLTITGSGNASFSSSTQVLTTTATTDTNGQVTVTIYNAGGGNTLTSSCTIANTTQTASTTI